MFEWLIIVERRVVDSGDVHVLITVNGVPIPACDRLDENYRHQEYPYENPIACLLCNNAWQVLTEYFKIKQDTHAYKPRPDSPEFARMGAEEKEAVLDYRQLINTFKKTWIAFCELHKIPILADSPFDFDVTFPDQFARSIDSARRLWYTQRELSV